MKLQKFVAAWMFMAAAIAFGEGSDFPLKVEGCFDPKGGHIQGMCRGGGFTYLTNLTVRSGKMGRDISVTVVLPDAYDGKMRFPSSAIRARRSAFVSSPITSGTVMDILVM